MKIRIWKAEAYMVSLTGGQYCWRWFLDDGTGLLCDFESWDKAVQFANQILALTLETNNAGWNYAL